MPDLDNSQADLAILPDRTGPHGQHWRETARQREPAPTGQGPRSPRAHSGHCRGTWDHTRLTRGAELIPQPRGDKGAERKVTGAAAAIPHAFIRQSGSLPHRSVPCQEGLSAHRTLWEEPGFLGVNFPEGLEGDKHFLTPSRVQLSTAVPYTSSFGQQTAALPAKALVECFLH